MKRLILPRRRALVLAGGALAMPSLAAGIARAADDWPNKPVRYINVFPPGGPTDTLSRIVCHELSELTGQQFIVENKSGSGGNVGADVIANRRPTATRSASTPSPAARSRRRSTPSCRSMRRRISPASP
jgi:tripartite-type tricarboxylate transporter receptor subunit TctC